MECREVEVLLAARRELALGVEATVRDHLATCAGCRAEARRLAHMRELLGALALPADAPDERARQRLRARLARPGGDRRPLWLALGALGLTALLVVALMGRGPAPVGELPPTAGPTPTSQPPTATALPSATPRPWDEATDWQLLRERPLRLPTLSPGQPCPITPIGPDHPYVGGRGHGPIYSQLGVIHYASNEYEQPDAEGYIANKVLWRRSPDYSKPVLIRGRQIDGPHELRFSDGETEQRFPLIDQMSLSDASTRSGWGSMPAEVRIKAAGCYAYQVDGLEFSSVGVFEALDGDWPDSPIPEVTAPGSPARPLLAGIGEAIVTLDADTAQVTSVITSIGNLPVWSPAGDKMAFAEAHLEQRDGENYFNGEIYVANRDGSGRRRLTTLESDESEPVWSPDGQQIAFQSYSFVQGTFPDLYRIDADGRNQTQLTDHPKSDWAPAWSPDGRHIAFVSDRDGNPEIYRMRADGSQQQRLTSAAEEDYRPRWTPDGRQIIFETRRGGSWDIYIMDADGGNQRPIVGGPGAERQASLDPTGQRIAFASDRDGNFDLYTIGLDGNGLVRVTEHPASDAEPAWSPDGTLLAFTTYRDTMLQLHVVAPEGGAPSRFIVNTFSSPLWGPG